MPQEVMIEFADFYSDGLFIHVFTEYNSLRKMGFGAYLTARREEAVKEYEKAKAEYESHHTTIHDALKEKESESEHAAAVIEAINKNRQSESVKRHHLVIMDAIEDVDDVMKQEGTFWYCKCRMLQDEIKWIDHLLEEKREVLDKGPIPKIEEKDVIGHLKKTEVGAHFLLFRNYFKELEEGFDGEISEELEEKLRNHLLKILHTKLEEFEGASLKEQYNFILKFYEELLDMQERDLKKAKKPEDFALSVCLLATLGKELELLEYTMTLAIEALG